ncbi:MAG: AMP-binding protein [Candidatus Delongbacteria bacterium]|nr:AMP-binding protein [Candidatus Delongbacteria bacterium]
MINENSINTLADYINRSLEIHESNLFLAEIDGEQLTYGQTRIKLQEIKMIFKKEGIKPGDKIALLGLNSIHWALTYLAIVTYGAVAVPILNDFNNTSIHNIITISDSKLIFISSSLLDKIEGVSFRQLEKAYLLEDFSEFNLKSIPQILSQIKERVYEFKQYANHYLSEYLPNFHHEFQPQKDDLAAIVYTSGTTGNSKGVMLTHHNIVADIFGGVKYVPLLNADDRFLSLLPLAHTYECTIGLLVPLYAGASVHYLKQKPSPKVLLQAFEKVKPTLVCVVPLVIEKIYRKKIAPRLEGSFILRHCLRVGFLRRLIYRKAASELFRSLGGSIIWMGIGGAALHPEVERFLYEGRFPYSIGYGMTECSPLISGSGVKDKRRLSAGYALPGSQIRIDAPDPKTGIGEVQVKGPIVTLGYYKNSEETAKLFTPDGWLKTGDLGYLDRHHYLFLKGRSKNVIVGASGENIYPEEIEPLINQYSTVVESLVIKKNGKLTAFIYPDYDALRNELHLFDLDEKEIKSRINSYFNHMIHDINAG